MDAPCSSRPSSKAEGRIDDTTEREKRVTLQGALNYALAENWVMRLAAARNQFGTLEGDYDDTAKQQ